MSDILTRSLDVALFALTTRPFWAMVVIGLAYLLAFRPIRRSIQPADMDEARKLAAKRHNEHIKLFGTLCNTAGVATLGAALLVPYFSATGLNLDQDRLWWIGVGLALPTAGQTAICLMRSEA